MVEDYSVFSGGGGPGVVLGVGALRGGSFVNERRSGDRLSIHSSSGTSAVGDCNISHRHGPFEDLGCDSYFRCMRSGERIAWLGSTTTEHEHLRHENETQSSLYQINGIQSKQLHQSHQTKMAHDFNAVEMSEGNMHLMVLGEGATSVGAVDGNGGGVNGTDNVIGNASTGFCGALPLGLAKSNSAGILYADLTPLMSLSTASSSLSSFSSSSLPARPLPTSASAPQFFPTTPLTSCSSFPPAAPHSQPQEVPPLSPSHSHTLHGNLIQISHTQSNPRQSLQATNAQIVATKNDHVPYGPSIQPPTFQVHYGGQAGGQTSDNFLRNNRNNMNETGSSSGSDNNCSNSNISNANANTANHGNYVSDANASHNHGLYSISTLSPSHFLASPDPSSNDTNDGSVSEWHSHFLDGNSVASSSISSITGARDRNDRIGNNDFGTDFETPGTGLSMAGSVNEGGVGGGMQLICRNNEQMASSPSSTPTMIVRSPATPVPSSGLSSYPQFPSSSSAISSSSSAPTPFFPPQSSPPSIPHPRSSSAPSPNVASSISLSSSSQPFDSPYHCQSQSIFSVNAPSLTSFSSSLSSPSFSTPSLSSSSFQSSGLSSSAAPSSAPSVSSIVQSLSPHSLQVPSTFSSRFTAPVTSSITSPSVSSSQSSLSSSSPSSSASPVQVSSLTPLSSLPRPFSNLVSTLPSLAKSQSDADVELVRCDLIWVPVRNKEKITPVEDCEMHPVVIIKDEKGQLFDDDEISQENPIGSRVSIHFRWLRGPPRAVCSFHPHLPASMQCTVTLRCFCSYDCFIRGHKQLHRFYSTLGLSQIPPHPNSHTYGVPCRSFNWEDYDLNKDFDEEHFALLRQAGLLTMADEEQWVTVSSQRNYRPSREDVGHQLCLETLLLTRKTFNTISSRRTRQKEEELLRQKKKEKDQEDVLEKKRKEGEKSKKMMFFGPKVISMNKSGRSESDEDRNSLGITAVTEPSSNGNHNPRGDEIGKAKRNIDTKSSSSNSDSSMSNCFAISNSGTYDCVSSITTSSSIKSQTDASASGHDLGSRQSGNAESIGRRIGEGSNGTDGNGRDGKEREGVASLELNYMCSDSSSLSAIQGRMTSGLDSDGSSKEDLEKTTTDAGGTKTAATILPNRADVKLHSANCTSPVSSRGVTTDTHDTSHDKSISLAAPIGTRNYEHSSPSSASTEMESPLADPAELSNDVTIITPGGATVTVNDMDSLLENGGQLVEDLWSLFSDDSTKCRRVTTACCVPSARLPPRRLRSRARPLAPLKSAPPMASPTATSPPSSASAAPLVSTASDQSKAGAGMTLMTWNVLAEIYGTLDAFPHCDPYMLAWSYRMTRILAEILQHNPDIVCLQEVQSEHFEDFFRPSLGSHGYEGVYKQKTKEIFTSGSGKKSGGKYTMDGCATFYKRNKFRVVENYALEFSKLIKEASDRTLPKEMHNNPQVVKRLLKDNIALVLLLELLEDQPTENADTSGSGGACHGGSDSMPCDAEFGRCGSLGDTGLPQCMDRVGFYHHQAQHQSCMEVSQPFSFHSPNSSMIHCQTQHGNTHEPQPLPSHHHSGSPGPSVLVDPASGTGQSVEGGALGASAWDPNQIPSSNMMGITVSSPASIPGNGQGAEGLPAQPPPQSPLVPQNRPLSHTPPSSNHPQALHPPQHFAPPHHSSTQASQIHQQPPPQQQMMLPYPSVRSHPPSSILGLQHSPLHPPSSSLHQNPLDKRQHQVVIANTHIVANPEANDVKIWQAQTLVGVLEHYLHEAFRRLGFYPGLIMCGDFNSTPDSAVYQLISSGKCEQTHEDLITDRYGLLADLQLGHSLSLKSAYSVSRALSEGLDPNDHRSLWILEPPFTNYTGTYMGCLDYVFFTDETMRLVSSVDTVDEAQLKQEAEHLQLLHWALPNPLRPSDHISLIAEFEWI